MTTDSAAAAILQALERAAGRADAARQLGRLPVALALEVGGSRIDLSSQGPQVSISAPLPLWQTCLGAAPPPGFHSAGALMRTHADFRISGEALPVAQCLGLLEALVEAARGELAAAGALSRHGRALQPEQVPEAESLGLIHGRYLPLDVPDLGSVWVYEESTGAQALPPMLLLHTAGADSRQWHALMTDQRLLADWRMLAFDLPFHGRSNPPLHWNGDPWRLDARRRPQSPEPGQPAPTRHLDLRTGRSRGLRRRPRLLQRRVRCCLLPGPHRHQPDIALAADGGIRLFGHPRRQPQDRRRDPGRALPGNARTGPFPMVENPDLLMTWLQPLAAAGARSLAVRD